MIQNPHPIPNIRFSAFDSYPSLNLESLNNLYVIDQQNELQNLLNFPSFTSVVNSFVDTSNSAIHLANDEVKKATKSIQNTGN